MDGMQDIEKMVADIVERDESPAPASVAEESAVEVVEQVQEVAPARAPVAPVAVALDNVAGDIVTRAQDRINSDRIIDKHAKALARNADQRISNEIERQNVENERRATDNKIDRKELANRLYKIKEESKRLKKEQKHLSRMQKQEHKAAKLHAYWVAHKEVLEQYKMREGSSIIACNILLWLDGLKSFFLGLSKVSDSIVKALKYIIIISVVAAILFAVPVTRHWLASILGFVK